MADRRSWQAFRSPNPASVRGRVTAVLGPTNTGKTHFAIERMLAYRSGMIGLPLRLLAREVFDKIVRLKGAADVALITGEERIVPKFPRYLVNVQVLKRPKLLSLGNRVVFFLFNVVTHLTI